MLMVRDPLAQHRYDIEASKLADDIAAIVQNVNEAHEAGIFTEEQVSELFRWTHLYEMGTLKLLRRVYEIQEGKQ